MTTSVLLNSPFEIQAHILFAIIALILGPVALYRRKRDRWHKVMGYIWVAAMAGTALSGLAIKAAVLPLLGPFGPIHIFSIFVLVSLWQGITAIRARNVPRHLAAMRGLYWQGMAIAGLLTLMPGRRLNALIFGPNEHLGWIVIAAGLAGIIWMIARPSRGAKMPMQL